MLPKLKVNSVFYYTRWGKNKVLEYRLILISVATSFPGLFPLDFWGGGSDPGFWVPHNQREICSSPQGVSDSPWMSRRGKNTTRGAGKISTEQHLFFKKNKNLSKVLYCALSENFIPSCTRGSQVLWDRLLEGYVENLNFALAFYFGNHSCHTAVGILSWQQHELFSLTSLSIHKICILWAFSTL